MSIKAKLAEFLPLSTTLFASISNDIIEYCIGSYLCIRELCHATDFNIEPYEAETVTITKLFGKLESIYDQPALVTNNDIQIWMHRGLIHRATITDGITNPAYVDSNDTICWVQHGQYYRENDLPTLVDDPGYYKCWMIGDAYISDKGPSRRAGNSILVPGIMHRVGGPAVLHNDGRTGELWYMNDKLHRDDGGPAVHDNARAVMWFQNGMLHRDDGPAVVYNTGENGWYSHGKYVFV